MFASTDNAVPAKRGSRHLWSASKARTGPWVALDFQTTVRILLYYKIMQAKWRRHKNNYDENVGRIEKGEARRRLKLTEAKLTTVQVIKQPL